MDRRTRTCAALLFCAIVQGVLARDAGACTCVSGTPVCETFWKTPVVFAGEVLEITSVPNHAGTRFPAERLVRFRVEQSWRGEAAGEIQIQTGAGGGDCGYDFERGVRYLVYARHYQGRLSTGICSRTKPLTEAAEDLEYLKTALKPSAAGRIFGRVTYQRTSYDGPVRPIAGYTITLSGAQKERRTTTDADGRYEFGGVPTGTYAVDVLLPQTEHAYGSRTAELVDPRGCVAADFSVVFDGRIGVRLVHADGRPASGYTIEVATLDSLQTVDRYPFAQPFSTGEDGRGDVARLAPNRYVLGLGITRGASAKQPHGLLFYPGVTDLANAQVIDLAAGERVDLGDFVLPPTLPKQILTGVLIWPDGTPAPSASVILWTIRDGRTRDSVSTTTDAEGRFTFPAYLGEHYRLTAFVSAGQRSQWAARSADFDLTAESAQQKLTLAEPRRPPR